jgi:glycosyltransferase involved in cell wall biosynthesis
MMIGSPVFSIVVATYNRGRHIIPTIDSVLGQSFGNFELLVVGDGVADDTLEHVTRLDSRVGVISLPWNSGSQATPNNIGISAAKGEYIAYLGHDDLWMPDHLESDVTSRI